MMRRSRLVTMRLLGFGALLGLLMASVALAGAQTDDSSGIRFVHAGIDTPPINVSLNGDSAAEGLFWLEATEYTDVPAGDHEISIFDPETSEDQALSTATITLEPGKNYSAVISGELPSPTIVLVADGSDGEIEAGMGGVRFFNSVPDGSAIDLVGKDNAPLVDGINPMTVSDYVMAEAGSYDIDFYESGADNRIFIEQGLTVEEGVFQTVYLSGFADPGNFSAEIIVDEYRETGDETGEPTATEAEPTATADAATETAVPATETPVAPTATPEPIATATPAPALPSTGAGGTATGGGGTNLLLFSALAALCLTASGGLFYWTRRFS